MTSMVMNTPTTLDLAAEAHEINDHLQRLNMQINTNNSAAKSYKQNVESYMLGCSENAKRIQELSNAMHPNPKFSAQCTAYIEGRKQVLSQLSDHIDQKRTEIFTSIGSVINAIDDVQKTVYKRLNNWHGDQVLLSNGDRGLEGNNSRETLDEIQNWFGELFILIWNTRTLIDSMRNSDISHSQSKLNGQFEQAFSTITKFLQDLIVSSFVVEEQPPQVIKKDTRFAATVRLLLVNFNIELIKPRVTVSVLSETQAKIQQKNSMSETSGDILNNTGSLDLRLSNVIPQMARQLVCNLRNMQLKKIKRSEKRGSECVMDEKFALLFQTKFQIFDLQLNVWVMSLPVVVTVHGSQESPAWATVTWDNAFHTIDRIPFEVVDKVPWNTMAWALRIKFLYQTGCCLSDENLHYLCEKAFGASFSFLPGDHMLSWTQFCKDLLPDRDFTFWDWFYAIMKLTRDHLSGPWNENLIVGFIAKDHAENRLLECQPGTFLLRFSDSILGGISVAYVELDDSQHPYVVSLQPFCHKDFENSKYPADHHAKRPTAEKNSFLSVGDLIKDVQQCVYLYSDKSSPGIKRKDEAFGKYYTQEVDKSKTGYVIPKRQIVVPPTGNECRSECSASSTPKCNRLSPDSFHFDTPSVTSLSLLDMSDFSDNGYQNMVSSPMDANDDFNELLNQANLDVSVWQNYPPFLNNWIENFPDQQP